MTTTSLFSRAHRPGVREPKKIRGFLGLPGEIRNQIYRYYLETERRCEIASEGAQFTQRKLQTVKLSSNLIATKNTPPAPSSKSKATPPIVVRVSRPLGKYNAVQGLRTNWSDSLYALSLVCKQIHSETATLIYEKTIFVFNAPKRMNNFFTFASSTGIENITKLHLHYDTYGPPEKFRHLIWQEKHRQSWQRACKVASKRLTTLRELEVWVNIHESAPKFNLREGWLKPLLQFRRLASPEQSVGQDAMPEPFVQRQPGLHVAKIHVQTPYLRTWMIRVDPGLIRAHDELHYLFGQAIGLAITGATEEAAMAGFNEAWDGRHAMWRHLLRFAATGWLAREKFVDVERALCVLLPTAEEQHAHALEGI